TESTEFHALTGPCGSGGVAGFRTGVEPAPPAVQAKKALLQIQPGSGLSTLSIMVKEAGEYQLTISTLNGEQVQQVPLGFLQKGLVEKTVPAAEYTPGTLFVHLYRNGELQHTQEWAFKK
ncbi:MAG: hypothetical protein JNM68_14390, partial [Dinghuibacter sp.]|nr:hypothetical protein [Dinghuibacter sp.]